MQRQLFPVVIKHPPNINVTPSPPATETEHSERQPSNLVRRLIAVRHLIPIANHGLERQSFKQAFELIVEL